MKCDLTSCVGYCFWWASYQKANLRFALRSMQVGPGLELRIQDD